MHAMSSSCTVNAALPMNHENDERRMAIDGKVANYDNSANYV